MRAGDVISIPEIEESKPRPLTSCFHVLRALCVRPNHLQGPGYVAFGDDPDFLNSLCHRPIFLYSGCDYHAWQK